MVDCYGKRKEYTVNPISNFNWYGEKGSFLVQMTKLPTPRMACRDNTLTPATEGISFEFDFNAKDVEERNSISVMVPADSVLEVESL
jgi:hypothetical protein